MKLPVVNYDPRNSDFLWLSLLACVIPRLLLSTAWGGMGSTSSGPHSRFPEGTESSDLLGPWSVSGKGVWNSEMRSSSSTVGLRLSMMPNEVLAFLKAM